MDADDIKNERRAIADDIAMLQYEDTNKIIKAIGNDIKSLAIKDKASYEEIAVNTSMENLIELSQLSKRKVWKIESEINDVHYDENDNTTVDKAYASFLLMKTPKNDFSTALSLLSVLEGDDLIGGEFVPAGALENMRVKLQDDLNNLTVDSFTSRETEGTLVLENFSVPHDMPLNKISMYFTKIIEEVCQIMPDQVELMIPQRFFYLCKESKRGDFTNEQLSASGALKRAKIKELPEKYLKTEAAGKFAEYSSPVESVVNQFVYERLLVGALDSNKIQKNKINEVSSERLCDKGMIADCLYIQLPVSDVKEKMKHKVLNSTENKAFPSNVQLLKILESIKPNQKECYTSLLKEFVENDDKQEKLRVQKEVASILKGTKF